MYSTDWNHKLPSTRKFLLVCCVIGAQKERFLSSVTTLSLCGNMYAWDCSYSPLNLRKKNFEVRQRLDGMLLLPVPLWRADAHGQSLTRWPPCIPLEHRHDHKYNKVLYSCAFEAIFDGWELLYGINNVVMCLRDESSLYKKSCYNKRFIHILLTYTFIPYYKISQSFLYHGLLWRLGREIHFILRHAPTGNARSIVRIVVTRNVIFLRLFWCPSTTTLFR